MKLTVEHAERAAEIWARRWLDVHSPNEMASRRSPRATAVVSYTSAAIEWGATHAVIARIRDRCTMLSGPVCEGAEDIPRGVPTAYRAV